MAAGIAHEIRNPLASMSGSLQILRQELPLSDEQSQLMDIVLRESDRLNETIRSFLAYARPQRNAAAPVDVRQVVTETATLLQNSPELMEAHAIRLDVPEAALWCMADEAQIRQIVWNLATNGLRAMPDGGALTLAATEGASGVIIRVGGFAKGTGLGLSIVHRIVSDYGGELGVRSQPGQGTTVTVKLPLATPPGKDVPEAARAGTQ